VLTIDRLVTPLIALDDPFEVQLRQGGGQHGAADLLAGMAAGRAGQRLAARLIVALHGLGDLTGDEPVGSGGLPGPWVWSIPPRH
jgi:hypothetical protein